MLVLVKQVCQLMNSAGVALSIYILKRLQQEARRSRFPQILWQDNAKFLLLTLYRFVFLLLPLSEHYQSDVSDTLRWNWFIFEIIAVAFSS